jgi:hypothetical protein
VVDDGDGGGVVALFVPCGRSLLLLLGDDHDDGWMMAGLEREWEEEKRWSVCKCCTVVVVQRLGTTLSTC